LRETGRRTFGGMANEDHCAATTVMRNFEDLGFQTGQTGISKAVKPRSDSHLAGWLGLGMLQIGGHSARRGTFDRRRPSPSEIVGCVITASRSFW
jgi:hypothetical protein